MKLFQLDFLYTDIDETNTSLWIQPEFLSFNEEEWRELTSDLYEASIDVNSLNPRYDHENPLDYIRRRLEDGGWKEYVVEGYSLVQED